MKPQPILTAVRVSLLEALERHRAACLDRIQDVQSEHNSKLAERIKVMEENEKKRKEREEWEEKEIDAERTTREKLDRENTKVREREEREREKKAE